jgi:hypothetical protein
MFKTILLSLTITLASCGAYASCRPVTIIAPDGTMTICQVCNDGRIVICT